MKHLFHSIIESLTLEVSKNEFFTCSFYCESSNFVRINKAKIRQPGHVFQASLQIDLIVGQKHAISNISITQDPAYNTSKIKESLTFLREQIKDSLGDPYLLVNKDSSTSSSISNHSKNDIEFILNDIISKSSSFDVVGILSEGSIATGTANSNGQNHWHETHNFNFDWSLYHEKDKAVKASYAGNVWDSKTFNEKMEWSKEQLNYLKLPPISLTPGSYKTYLAPAALNEVIELLCWGGFSYKEQQTKGSSLLKLLEKEKSFHEKLTLFNNLENGLSPKFQASGFIKPTVTPLIKNGKHEGSMISPRSSVEYSTDHNGADNSESPTSIEVSPGTLSQNEVLKQLDTGLYINNLWYLNYSDRSQCRMTGMTRFASFWVENGKINAPLNVMRFDDSAYKMLGKNLIDFTQERDLLIDPSTYSKRSTNSSYIPGALINDFQLKL